MQRKNNGYMLVTVLLLLSISSVMTMSSLVYLKQNYNIIDSAYMRKTLEYNSYNIVEVIYSNVLEVVESSLENINTESEFVEYFSGNNGEILKSTSNIEEEYNFNFTIQSFVMYNIENNIQIKIVLKTEYENLYDRVYVEMNILNPYSLGIVNYDIKEIVIIDEIRELD